MANHPAFPPTFAPNYPPTSSVDYASAMKSLVGERAVEVPSFRSRVEKIDNGYVIHFEGRQHFVENPTEVGRFVTAQIVKIFLLEEK